MADIVSPEKRSEMMAGISGKNTKPEILIRRLLHSCGFRFRLHDKSLPGKPDIVLKKWNTVVLVDGCFWHGHENCQIFRLPKSKTEFWQQKIRKNIDRDKRNIEQLISDGWNIIRVWECATKGKGRLSFEEIISLIKAAIISNHEIAEIRGSLMANDT